MDISFIKRIIEAVLLASTEPVSLDKLLTLLPEEFAITPQDLRQYLYEMQDTYHENSIELQETASGYRFQIRAEFAPHIVKLWEEKPARFSRALLETLVIIAYRQPITRAEIEDIRGVAVSTGMVKTLQDREWIRLVGYRDVPGRPGIYATTKTFLDYFNLKSLDELPPLQDIKDLDLISQQFEQQLTLNLETHEQTTPEIDYEAVPDPEPVAEPA
jgi:segregation and condensation protein B